MLVEITLTGDVSVGRADAGDRQVVAGPARVVLAALVIERATGLTRDALAGVVWPEAMPTTWASALRTHVSKARHGLTRAAGLSGEVIAATADGYELELPSGVELVVDVEQAADLLTRARRVLPGDAATAGQLARAAAEAVRAPFLRGHPGRWADDVRQRLDDLAIGALTLASEAAATLGDHTAAVGAADEAVQRAPLREDAHRALISALAKAGNRAEALRAYQRLRRRLADELGIDPSPETDAVYLTLLGSDHAARATRAGAPGAHPVSPFVGRQVELSELTDAWEQAAEGGRHLVVISGEAGIGKSRLATEAARHVATAGGLVLLGGCDEEGIVPYQPVVEALDGLVAATPEGELPALGPAAVSELARLLPSFPAPAGDRAASDPPAPPDRARLFGAVTELVAAVARRRPVLLVLDDLQWADDDTLLLVRHLLRRAGGAAVLVVAVTRDHDLGTDHALADVIHALDRDGWVRRLPLGGLGERDIRDLLAHLRGAGDHGEDARRLLAETAGNAFFVTELARASGGRPPAGAEIPRSVQALVAARLARLAPEAVDLLRAGAVGGAQFHLEVAGAAAGLEEAAVLDAADAAVASGLVVEESSDRYRFPHDVVRRTIDTQLTGARRRILHRRTADALERLQAGALDAPVAALARHAAAGADPGGDLRAVTWSRRAAVEAARRGGLSEAARLARQAHAHVPPTERHLVAEVTVEVGLAAAAAGDASAADDLARGGRLALALDRRDLLARAAVALADAAAADPAHRAAARELVDAALGRGDLASGGGGAAEPAARPGDATGPPRAGGSPDLDPGVVEARLVVRRLRLGGDLRPGERGRAAELLGALHRLVTASRGPTRLDERQRVADELATLADAAGDAGYRAVAAHHVAMAAAEAGDDPTVDKSLAVLSGAADDGDLFATAVLAQREVTLHLTEGRVDPAAAALLLAVEAVQRAEAAAPDHPGTALLDPPDEIRARHRVVMEWLRGADPPPVDPAAPGDEVDLHAAAVAAIAAVARDAPGDVGRARAALAPFADRTCGTGYLSFAGAASFHLGRLAAAEGDLSEAERHLEAALRRHTTLRARAWIALTKRALADVLARRGLPSDRDWIDALRSEAEHVTSSLGLRPG